MPNYQDGKIYKIVCNITDECYIGSTTQPTLARRLTGHMTGYKSWKEGKSKKVTSYDIIDRGDYQILLIENFPCNSKDELTAKEGEIIRQYRLDCGCANRCIAGRSKKEWNDDNKVNIQLQHKQYREENKEKIQTYQREYDRQYREKNNDLIKMKKAEKIECTCGSCYSRDSKARHERTNKHQDYLKSIQ
jgi:hypothetical protein